MTPQTTGRACGGRTVHVPIRGMDRAHCTHAVRDRPPAIPGVEAVVVLLPAGEAGPSWPPPEPT
jgi:hypothetical protein